MTKYQIAVLIVFEIVRMSSFGPGLKTLDQKCIFDSFSTRDNELFQTLFRTKKPSPFTILKNCDNCEKYKILDDEMFKDGDDDLSDLTSSEQSQLNDWYDNLSSKYDKVGNIIREVSQS